MGCLRLSQSETREERTCNRWLNDNSNCLARRCHETETPASFPCSPAESMYLIAHFHCLSV